MASVTVQHGRRRGQERATPELPVPSNYQASAPVGMHLPDGTDLRQVTILSKNDWERIHYQLHKKELEGDQQRKLHAQREDMKNKSKELVQHWGNTLKGKRDKRLLGRQLRLEKEEEERRHVDLEEAKFQAKERKERIDKAKMQQYYQTDRVKTFHTGLILTEVLKEREAQQELKKLRAQANDGMDREWLLMAQRDYEEAIREDQRKAADRFQAAKDNSSFQQAQIRSHIQNDNQRREENLKEGEELQKLALQHHLETQHLNNINTTEKKKLMNENIEQIQNKKILKEINNEREEEENEECRIFAAAKRKMMKLRSNKEQQMYNERLERLDRISQKLSAQAKQDLDNEDQRISDAVKEQDEKKDREEAEKEIKLKKAIKEQAEHRHMTMIENERKQKEQRRQELEDVRLRKAADNIFYFNEEEKVKKKREETKKLTDYRHNQTDERINKERAERDAQLALDKANVDLLQYEEDQFQEYASKVIAHCENGGRNVIPLKKAAKPGAGGGVGPVFEGKGGIRPSYMTSDTAGKQMPHYVGDTTEDVKDTIYGKAKSKQRLGFVWN